MAATAAGFYMQYLESLCRRRGWQDPTYDCRHDQCGYACLVTVNDREYQTDLAYESGVLARENAAMRAFMVCRNFSVNGGMLARNGIVQGLPAVAPDHLHHPSASSSHRHRRSRLSPSHSASSSASSSSPPSPDQVSYRPTTHRHGHSHGYGHGHGHGFSHSPSSSAASSTSSSSLRAQRHGPVLQPVYDHYYTQPYDQMAGQFGIDSSGGSTTSQEE